MPLRPTSKLTLLVRQSWRNGRLPRLAASCKGLSIVSVLVSTTRNSIGMGLPIDMHIAWLTIVGRNESLPPCTLCPPPTILILHQQNLHMEHCTIPHTIRTFSRMYRVSPSSNDSSSVYACKKINKLHGNKIGIYHTLVWSEGTGTHRLHRCQANKPNLA